MNTFPLFLSRGIIIKSNLEDMWTHSTFFYPIMWPIRCNDGISLPTLLKGYFVLCFVASAALSQLELAAVDICKLDKSAVRVW